MCLRPIQVDAETTVACRECDECIATRKNGWVARGMAECAVAGEAIAIELTYRNLPDGSPPTGARAFRYADVQRFLKKIRSAYSDQYEATGEVKYICAGERGSERDRVHWHLVLFSEKSLLKLGVWKDAFFRKIGEVVFEERIHWSMWDHGYVWVKPASQESVEYALKYATKDQFAWTKSRGHKRETKSDMHGAGMFRMSKAPPLGERYLAKRLHEWRVARVVPTSLRIPVPDYSGYWWPQGKQREILLYGLSEINRLRRAETGRDCPQWKTLLSTVSEENERDFEALVYGQMEDERSVEERERQNQWLWKREVEQIAEQRERRDRAKADLETIRKCGSVEPCSNCLPYLSREDHWSWRNDAQKWREKYNAQGFEHDGTEECEAKFKRWREAQCKPNVCCGRPYKGLEAIFKRRKALVDLKNAITRSGPQTGKDV